MAFAQITAGECVCPKCGHKIPHVLRSRCKEISCPLCGTKMIRV